MKLIDTNFNYLKKKGFRIVKIDIPNNMFWAVDFEGKIHIHISWYWHDGISIMISRLGKGANEYSIETIVGFLKNKETVEQFHDQDDYYYIQANSDFLSAHLDKIIDFVADDQFEKYDPKLKQTYRELNELFWQKIRQNKL